MAAEASTMVQLDLDTRQSDALDAIAQATARDRLTVIDDAIEAYLEVYRWQVDHIKEGIRQADAGEFASPEELADFFAHRA